MSANRDEISQEEIRFFKEVNTSTPLTQYAIERIVKGEENTPFNLLGLHRTKSGADIRVFMPEADKVYVIDAACPSKKIAMRLTHPAGFFCVTLANIPAIFHYQLEVFWTDHRQLIEDPYRFCALPSCGYNNLASKGLDLDSYWRLGAHPASYDNVSGIRFCVWAPNAKRVAVVGEFNKWDIRWHPMKLGQESGLWEIFLPQAKIGQLYKFAVTDSSNNRYVKADPYAHSAETGPGTASKIYPLSRPAHVDRLRLQANQPNKPISIYEVHLGSWRRHKDDNSWLSYRELAQQLIPYVKDMGFTHIELLPVSEHPFDGSWGYQPIGLYAPTNRFGTPDDLKFFIDCAHQAGLSLIFDWVPGHFPDDPHGLHHFDGSSLYEYADPREGFHPDWNTYIYNYSRPEVRQFLSNNALYWLEQFDFDAIRVDAVSSMLYKDFSRKAGEWIANIHGGRENLEAIDFLRCTNGLIKAKRSGAVTIAEESTSFSGVTMPLESGGLGFDYKWNMGWMNDTLSYIKLKPSDRKYHHALLTFGMSYAYTENYILPLSHDETVYGKGSMVSKIPGDTRQKFATLRAYYAYMWAHPGKKLLFMGNEFAQVKEWDHDGSLQWHLVEPQFGGEWHRGIQRLIKDLNTLYRTHPALYELDYRQDGFEWLVVDDVENSVTVFLRRDSQDQQIIIITNFTDALHERYRFGIDRPGIYDEILNTDSLVYRGNSREKKKGIRSEPVASHRCQHSLAVALPPLSTLYLLQGL